WLDVAERELFGVTMIDGTRRQQLFSSQLYLNAIPAVVRMFYDRSLRERTYWVHIGDSSWPDDTLLEFDYLEDPPLVAGAAQRSQLVIGQTTKAQVEQSMGMGSSTRFDNGFEVWIYDDQRAIPELLHWLPGIGNATTAAEASSSVHQLAILFD